jgi:asparagine synthase (glutamine-hydrolysing)
MAYSIGHRGPDASGVFIDKADTGEAIIALSHRRLSIIDLTQAGQQPMTSSSGRFVMVYNGEIYNHADIRRDLGLPREFWRGQSDTETLLQAIETWGINKALQSAVGMFAFALWDCWDRVLFLARDRFGEKPLYYGWQGDSFLFASELKSFCAHPAFKREINTETLGNYFRYGNISGSEAIWKGIRKLPPASILRLSADRLSENPQFMTYWSVNDEVRSASEHQFSGSIVDAEAQFQSLLSNAVSQQMIADVPLGAFLSGGIDSSLIVSEMQARASRPVHTFTIGFTEKDYDESGFAQRVAKHFGTNHTTLIVSALDAQNVVPTISDVYDEPFADISAIPTLLVSRLARSQVTVALTGDGADELFAGYSRYHDWKTKLAGHLSSLSPALTRKLLSLVVPDMPRTADAGETFRHLYEISMSQWQRPPVAGAQPINIRGEPIPSIGPLKTMMLSDLRRYMPDGILTKVDRAAMSVSLETRAPFLDHRIAEFAFTLPPSILADMSRGKKLLRRSLYRNLPRELVDRPKMGFGLPVDHWMRDELRDWAEDLLSEESLARSGLLDIGAIRARWSEHIAGSHNHRDPLWIALMFQSWFNKNLL